MIFSIEKKISNFVQNQFPDFYEEDGPNFMLFVQAYYEFMEQSGNPIAEGRNLLDYRDVDNALDSFLVHFQKKYLYGIPFNVISNKRFLLKHVIDLYRSKGSIQGYKLLFKMVYNEDIDVYLPGRDILKASDGTWIDPKYIEVSDNGSLNSLVGKTIQGVISKTTAIVESYIQEPINQSISNILYVSNIYPKGGTFINNEKVFDVANLSSNNSNEPNIIGSLLSLNILNGGQGFSIGDVLKIASRDSNNQIVSNGRGGVVKVLSITAGQGFLNYNILNGGTGYTINAITKTYNGTLDTTGNSSKFLIGNVLNTQNISYNTDIIASFADMTINATAFGFIGNTSANISSTIQSSLTFTNAAFGTISSLSNINAGNNYTQQAITFARSVQLSNSLPGTISYNTSSNTLTLVGGDFTRYYGANDFILLQSNLALTSTQEYAVIQNVTNSTSISLYGPPSLNSTPSATYYAAPGILYSDYALYESTMNTGNNTISGYNSNILGIPSVGNNIVNKISVISSGKNYIDSEYVKVYLYNCVNAPTVINGGTLYSNTDTLVFSGGGSLSPAKGGIITNSNGSIISTFLTSTNSGYKNIPTIKVKSKSGSNAVLITTISEFNKFSEINAKVIKGGIGKDAGYWSTTKGFLNSNKYLQDSYFYQDYSYQLKTAIQFNTYKNILLSTFHTSGNELFGTYIKSDVVISLPKIVLYEQTSAIFS